MSRSINQKITCAECHITFEASLYTSVNSRQSPELNKLVLSNSLNQLNCPICKIRIKILQNLLYHDQDLKFMVWFKLNAADGVGLEEFIKDDPTTVRYQMNRFIDTYRLRLVDSMEQLVEKIYAFEFGLDDAILEYVKMLTWHHHVSKETSERYPTKGFLCRPTSLPSGEKLLLFHIVGSGEPKQFSLQIEAYSVLEKSPEIRSKLSCGNGTWTKVNQDFVLNHF
jgi:hypothetical protein